MKRLCVFCGANAGTKDIYRSAAHELGRLLARSGIGLVYGGAGIGLMGAVADLDSAGAERFFAELLEACGIAMPQDWRERVRIGARASR